MHRNVVSTLSRKILAGPLNATHSDLFIRSRPPQRSRQNLNRRSKAPLTNTLKIQTERRWFSQAIDQSGSGTYHVRITDMRDMFRDARLFNGEGERHLWLCVLVTWLFWPHDCSVFVDALARWSQWTSSMCSHLFSYFFFISGSVLRACWWLCPKHVQMCSNSSISCMHLVGCVADTPHSTSKTHVM